MSSFEAIQSALRLQNAPASHCDRIARIAALARREPQFRAIFLVGSYAQGRGDRVSDLDLVAIVAEGMAKSALSHVHAALRSDDVLHQFTGRHASGGIFWKLIYLDFSSVEFHVFEPSTSFRLRHPYLTVWDPENLAPEYSAEGDPIRHEDFAAYEYGDDGLAWELLDCIKWLSRGKAALARHHIAKIAERMRANA